MMGATPTAHFRGIDRPYCFHGRASACGTWGDQRSQFPIVECPVTVDLGLLVLALPIRRVQGGQGHAIHSDWIF
jgi:hypothetical protein